MVWVRICQNTLEELKSMLTPRLSHTRFNPKLETILARYASEYWLVSVFIHKCEDGSQKFH